MEKQKAGNGGRAGDGQKKTAISSLKQMAV
jgi:hypothetical protein